jgi:RNA polymerase sigma-70 factor (ECF subfamily)
VADLVRLHGARVYQLALRYLRNPEDAEELAQDVLFRAVAKIGEFRGDSVLSSWLFRITFNAAMSRLRRLRGARAAEAPDVRSLDDATDGVPAEELQDRRTLADEDLLRGQLLKSRLHRGRLMLRRELADFAGGLTLHRAAS